MHNPALIAGGQIGAPSFDGAPSPFIMLPGPEIGAILVALEAGVEVSLDDHSSLFGSLFDSLFGSLFGSLNNPQRNPRAKLYRRK